MESKYSAIYKLGMIAIQENQLDEAYKYFKWNIDNSPHEETFSIIELSKIEVERGNLEEAINILNKHKNLNNSTILLQKASVLRLQGEYEEAYSIIKNNEFLDNPNIKNDYYIIKGCIEIELEKYQEAEESLTKAITIEKSNTYYKAITELAYLYYKTGYLDKSSELCLEIINNSDNKCVAKAMIIQGNICKFEAKYEETLKYFLKSVEYEHYADQKGYICIANLYILQKEYNKANEYINKYLESAHTEKAKSAGYLKLALIASKQNKTEDIEKNLSRVKREVLEGMDLDDYRSLKRYVRYIKGLPPKYNNYNTSQLYNYSIESLIKHIDKVHTNQDEESIFNDKINLEELVLQMPALLSNAKIIQNNYYEYYQINYPNIGYVNGEESNTLRLIVFPQTNKVLTMFPVKDITNKKKIEIKSKQKVKSQIDKFNERYKKKSQ